MTRADRFRQLTSTTEVREDLRARSLRAATLAWCAGFGDFLVRFVSTAILARLVLPEQFGLVMMITAVTSIADQFRDMGLSTATVQRESVTHEEITNLFWINFAAGLSIAATLCAVAPLVADYYGQPTLIAPTYVLASNFVWGGLIVQHQALLTRRLRLGRLAALRLVASVLSTGLAIWLAWRGFGYWALVWREVFRCALLAAGVWVALPWVPGLPSRHTDVKRLVTFGADLSLANVIMTFSGTLDRLLLGRYWGATPTALYRQAYQLLILPSEQLLSPVYNVTQPGLSMLQTESQRFCRFYLKVLSVACIASMPVSLFVVVYAEDVTRVALGEDWVPAAPLLTILSVSNFVKHPIWTTSLVLIALGKSRVHLTLVLLQNVVATLLICGGIRWGAAGVAYAEVATTYLMIGPRLHYTIKHSALSLGTFLATLGRPAMASAVMAMTLVALRRFLPGDHMQANLVLGALTAALVFPAVWTLLPGGRAEVRGLASDLQLALGRHGRAPTAQTPVAAEGVSP